MKTNRSELKEKAASYGLMALTDAELISLIGFRGDPDEFWSSQSYKAMKEITRREQAKEVRSIRKSQDVVQHMAFLADLEHEEFWVIYTNRQNNIQKISFISKGDVSGTIVGIKEILKEAITLKARGLFLVHNHPSGSLKPSESDIKITMKVKEAARLIDTEVLDHVIIGGNMAGHFSFADEGIM